MFCFLNFWWWLLWLDLFRMLLLRLRLRLWLLLLLLLLLRLLLRLRVDGPLEPATDIGSTFASMRPDDGCEGSTSLVGDHSPSPT